MAVQLPGAVHDTESTWASPPLLLSAARPGTSCALPQVPLETAERAPAAAGVPATAAPDVAPSAEQTAAAATTASFTTGRCINTRVTCISPFPTSIAGSPESRGDPSRCPNPHVRGWSRADVGLKR